ncbi:MAG: glycerol-3-phosphate 1-O-acyltransferase PlsY [Armatimonadota bacterium]|nr:glycerol-3-phosphate 1-O-acyltransferase PlsY [Armatimonadota bacterium]MDR5697208.1 glycerol-3-phosphate 1-O-acyltransferase PlsY [Armatimonadota bacterium]
MVGVLAVALGYVCGSLPTGLVAVRAFLGVDIRQHGSGNIGTVNVYRVAGPLLGALVLVADGLKGAVPVWVAQRADLDAGWAVAAGLAAIVGHNWSVFLRFAGGKGIATSFGVVLALSAGVGAVAVAVWVAAVAVTRFASVGSILAMLSVPVAMLVLRKPVPYVVFGAIAAALALYRHRSNIRRLIEGSELRIGDRAQ